MSSVPERVDFSANSKIYNHRHGAAISAQLVQAMANLLPRDAAIIDIGAGTGRVAVTLATNGFQEVAIDLLSPCCRPCSENPGVWAYSRWSSHLDNHNEEGLP
jgi:2-polyprenyl-3-methyl-5-hydroxy-6-metoxy-1,4-benzoquinol methylase